MSSSLAKYFDKNNLHHAYLIEGARDEILPELLKSIEGLGIKTKNNSDFIQITLDSVKVEDARNFKSYALEKANSTNKKVFVISANSFLREAQNTLLKMFEEPIENTHFFLIVPDTNSLLPTFVSRFYVIRTQEGIELKEAEEFIKMPLQRRIDFIKELITEEDEDEETIILDSARSKSLKFLNALETTLHHKFLKDSSLSMCLEHFFKVREFLRMPGSSTKSLMESVALLIPTIS